MKKKILIINTGGTISSVQSKHGFVPQEGFVKNFLAELPELNHSEMPLFDLIEFKPLLDSSNININDWNQLANQIKQNEHQKNDNN